MRRRAFVAGLVATALPIAAGGQERLRRVGMLIVLPDNDSEAQFRVATFVRALRSLGWMVGFNVRFDYRWSANRSEDLRKSAEDLVALTPDIILATGSAAVLAQLQATRTIPVVFVDVADPVGAGIVAAPSRPGGNVTGFTAFEYSKTDRRLDLLREIAPAVKRVAVLRDQNQPAAVAQVTALRGAASPLGIEVTPVNVRDGREIERAVTAIAKQPDGGLVVTASEFAVQYRDLILGLAAKLKLPAVYEGRFFAAAGGLMSYGPDLNEQYRLAAGYADRILKGEKPGDLPVRSANKYQLVINAKTAKALGLAVPQELRTRADEVIE